MKIQFLYKLYDIEKFSIVIFVCIESTCGDSKQITAGLYWANNETFLMDFGYFQNVFSIKSIFRPQYARLY